MPFPQLYPVEENAVTQPCALTHTKGTYTYLHPKGFTRIAPTGDVALLPGALAGEWILVNIPI